MYAFTSALQILRLAQDDKRREDRCHGIGCLPIDTAKIRHTEGVNVLQCPPMSLIVLKCLDKGEIERLIFG